MREVARRLLALLRPQAGLVAVSAMCRIVNQGLGVAIPAVAVALIFGVAEGTGASSTAISSLAGLALAKGVFRYLEQYTGHAVAFRLLAELRNEVFRWLERVEAARLDDERSGDLVARVSGDIDRVEPFYAHTISPLVAAAVVPLSTLIAMAWLIDGRVVLALAPFLVLHLAIVPWIGSGRVAGKAPEVRRLSGATAAAVADTVQGAREIAVLAARERVVTEVGRTGRARMRSEASLAKMAALRALSGGLVSAAALVVTALAAIGAGLELPELSMALVLAWTVMTPLRALEQIVPDTEAALAAAARLFAIEDVPPQAVTDAGVAPIDGEVRFDAVVVRAGTGIVVDSVTLEVPDGSFVGIVGPSGSGKSSLISTLVRHRDATSGRVVVGGASVTDMAPPVLADTVALVPQRPDVFYGTVASNLLLARPEADEGELLAALDQAQLGEWVAGLEEGIHTHLGERGVGLSGGQIQRLALARAFLRDPSVLALDEATSELDPVTERALLGRVLAERGRCTLLMVAHRMETITSADQIAVMSQGKIVETGTHLELKGAGGLYAALWRRHEDMLARV